MKLNVFSQGIGHLIALFQDIVLQLVKHHRQSALYRTSILNYQQLPFAKVFLSNHLIEIEKFCIRDKTLFIMFKFPKTRRATKYVS